MTVTSILVLTAALIFGGSASIVYGLAARAQRIAADNGPLQMGMPNDSGNVRGSHVRFLSDTLAVRADEPAVAELRFSVDDGFHINSHKPADEFMIPTTLTFASSDRLHVLGETYPPGAAYRLTVGAGETLSVYNGEIRIGVRLRAARGNSVLEGTLHYQACDHAACFPPRTLPFSVAVKAE